MAELQILGTNICIKNPSAIRDFLQNEGVLFGQFELTDLAKNLALQQNANDEERQCLLKQYTSLTEEHSKLGGFHQDVIFLHPGFPHYAYILEKFSGLHFHFESEYWYIFGGQGSFGFLSNQGFRFLLTVYAGEYLSVPEGKWQWLNGDVNQIFKAMRFFNTEEKFRPVNLEGFRVYSKDEATTTAI